MHAYFSNHPMMQKVKSFLPINSRRMFRLLNDIDRFMIIERPYTDYKVIERLRFQYLITISMMFDPFELFAGRNKGKFTKCWLAATFSTKKFQRKFKSLTINQIDVCQMCNDIKEMIYTSIDKPSDRVSLYLSSQLMCGVTKILLCQTSYLEKDVIELENMFDTITKTDKRDEKKNEKYTDSLNVTSTSSDQLHEAFKLLPYEHNIDTKLRNMMHDADCLEFGALTEEELRFLNPPDADCSAEMFGRMHITNDASLYDVNTLRDSEEFYIPFDKAEKETTISLVRDDFTLRDEEHRTAFTKITLPEVTVEEFMLEASTHLTPRKRLPDKITHLETPTKRRRFKDVAAQNGTDIATTTETEVVPVPVPAIDDSTEPLKELESIHEDSQQTKIKSKRKRKFVDKNTKLSHKEIRKWIGNVNAQTVPLSINNVNISTSKILFQAAPARFVSVRKNKWNSPLIKLFSMHLAVPSKRKKTRMEFPLLETSTEIVRLGEKSNKTDELIPELSVIKSMDANGKSIKETSTRELESSLQELVIPNIERQIDLQSIEQGFGLLNIAQNGTGPDLTIREKTIDQSQETIKLSQSCMLTKLDLLALLEVLWHDTDLVQFIDVIPPGEYSKADAVYCYLLLLELHQEKKITLEQAEPYDTLWIKKFSNGN